MRRTWALVIVLTVGLSPVVAAVCAATCEADREASGAPEPHHLCLHGDMPAGPMVTSGSHACVHEVDEVPAVSHPHQAWLPPAPLVSRFLVAPPDAHRRRCGEAIASASPPGPSGLVSQLRV